MRRLPLFPLNTVLFPGMPLALHIFEERYKLMIGGCIKTRQPFGVVLIRRGVEAQGPLAEPNMVGCTAQITQVQHLEQGRMNINAIGVGRFRVQSLDRGRPYLVGEITPWPLFGGQQEVQSEAARRLQPWVQRYLKTVSNFEKVNLQVQSLPDEPVALAYLAAALLQIPAGQKQPLLEARDAAQLLTDLRALYRREIAFLRAMLEKSIGDEDPGDINAGTISLN